MARDIKCDGCGRVGSAPVDAIEPDEGWHITRATGGTTGLICPTCHAKQHEPSDAETSIVLDVGGLQ